MRSGETRSSYGRLKARGFSGGRGHPVGWGLRGRGCCVALLWGWGYCPPVPSWVKGAGPEQGAGDPPHLTLSPGCVLALWPCWWPRGHAGSPMAMLVAPWPCRLPQQQGPEGSPGPCVNHRLPTSPMTRSLFPDTARRQPCVPHPNYKHKTKEEGRWEHKSDVPAAPRVYRRASSCTAWAARDPAGF